jgi:hypothetical protein
MTQAPRRKRATRRRATARAARAAGVTFADVRRAAQRLPGMEDGTSYGTPALKVKGKLLARLHQTEPALVLRTDLLGRQLLIACAPDVFYLTEHYRDYPWVLVRLAALDARALPDLLERAWRLVAPAALVRRHDAGA